MKNRIIALALCAGMLLLGGCASHDEAGAGSGDTSETNGGQAVNSPSTTEQAQPSEDTRTSFEKLFDDGPLLVQNADELWGYIDITGEYVIEPQFMSAYEFQDNGLAAVMDNVTGLWGISTLPENMSLSRPLLVLVLMVLRKTGWQLSLMLSPDLAGILTSLSVRNST